MMMKRTVKLMIKNAFTLLNHDKYLILTHKRPDGDTTGSASALCQMLRKVGKTAYILDNPDITPKYDFLIEPYISNYDYNPDCIVTCDLASTDLLPDNAKKYADKIDINIDHHVHSNTKFAKDNMVYDVAACGEIIFGMLKQLKLTLDRDIATAIYTSIATDTGCFKFSNTTQNTHIIAGECIKYINAGELNRKLFDVKTRARFLIEQRVLNNIEFHFGGKVSVSSISNHDKLETGATADDLDNIASLPRTIDGVEIAITITEQKNGEIKVSLRSGESENSSEIAGFYGGGGHLRAAGVSFSDDTIENVKCKMLDAVKSVCNYV